MNEKFDVLGASVDVIDKDSAVELIISEMRENLCFKYVVTPNADHLINLSKDHYFKLSYDSSWMCVADGWPVLLAAKILGRSLPGRVTGSDLVPSILSRCSNDGFNISVCIIGGIGDVPKRAAENIEKEYPGVKVSGFFSPNFGFDESEEKTREVVDYINSCNSDLIIVGLGSPKQEKWVYKNKDKIHSGVAICAGATVDFIAGSVKRAPVWVSKMGMEWLYRLIQEPSRLYRRYARVFIYLPRMIVLEKIKGK